MATVQTQGLANLALWVEEAIASKVGPLRVVQIPMYTLKFLIILIGVGILALLTLRTQKREVARSLPGPWCK